MIILLYCFDGKPTFTNGPRSLPKYLPDCIIAYVCVFGNSILADKVFEKAYGDLRLVYWLKLIFVEN